MKHFKIKLGMHLWYASQSGTPVRGKVVEIVTISRRVNHKYSIRTYRAKYFILDTPSGLIRKQIPASELFLHKAQAEEHISNRESDWTKIEASKLLSNIKNKNDNNKKTQNDGSSRGIFG